MNIAVIGTGHVGHVAGACFAGFGTSVTCVDIDEQKIAPLGEGRVRVYEPGLEQLAQKNAQAGCLSFTTDVGRAVEQPPSG
jgi:UDPglucose 6-dehydrogenase